MVNTKLMQLLILLLLAELNVCDDSPVTTKHVPYSCGRLKLEDVTKSWHWWSFHTTYELQFYDLTSINNTISTADNIQCIICKLDPYAKGEYTKMIYCMYAIQGMVGGHIVWVGHMTIPVSYQKYLNSHLSYMNIEGLSCWFNSPSVCMLRRTRVHVHADTQLVPIYAMSQKRIVQVNHATS